MGSRSDKLALRKNVTPRKRVPTTRLVSYGQMCDGSLAWHPRQNAMIRTAIHPACIGDSFLKRRRENVGISLDIMCASSVGSALIDRQRSKAHQRNHRRGRRLSGNFGPAKNSQDPRAPAFPPLRAQSAPISVASTRLGTRLVWAWVSVDEHWHHQQDSS